MQKIYILPLTILLSASVHAQNIKLPVGKKFGVTVVTEMKTKASAMGQEMEIGNNSTNTSDYEIKAVTNNGFTVTNTMKRMKVTASMMGTEQSFDTDDKASRDNPQLAPLVEMINKPYEIEVENKKATIKSEMSDISKMAGAGGSGIANDQAKFILTQPELAKLKEGNQWSDSVIDGGNKTIYEYTVLKKTEETTDILVKATLLIDATTKQSGMDIKQTLKGTSNGRRQYNTATGLLVKEDTDITMSGTMEVMGQTSPLSITGKIVTTVN